MTPTEFIFQNCLGILPFMFWSIWCIYMFSRVVCVIRSEIILGASILDFSVCYSSHASKCTIMIYVIVLYCSWLRVLTLTNLSTMHVNIQGMEGLWKNSGQKSWQKKTFYPHSSQSHKSKQNLDWFPSLVHLCHLSKTAVHIFPTISQLWNCSIWAEWLVSGQQRRRENFDREKGKSC